MVCQSHIRHCKRVTNDSENIRDDEFDILHTYVSTINNSSEKLEGKELKDSFIVNSAEYLSAESNIQTSSALCEDRIIEKKCLRSSTLISQHISIYQMFLRRKEIYTMYMLPSVELNHSEVASEALWHLYRKEINRLRTFQKYPISAPMSALVLANQGFVYIGISEKNKDTVACYACRAKKENWHPFDDVHQIHILLSPNCPMVTGIDCDNEPLVTSLTLNYQASVSESLGLGEGIRTDLQTTVLVESARQCSQFDSILQTDSSVEVESNEETSISYITELDTVATVQTNNMLRDISASSNSSTSNSLLENNRSDEINHTANQLEETSLTDQNVMNNIPEPINTTSHTSDTTNSELINSELVAQGITPQSSVPRRPSQQTQINTLTHQELGIITERPKRPEYAIKIKRLETFSNNWPRDHHLNPLDLIEAGFYYAGYGDCTRCFYCGGGLRNWEDEDHEWVEHARWFPRCAYLRQMMGQHFVDEVQKLHKEYEKISLEMVKKNMGASSSTFLQVEQKSQSLKNDAAVKSLLELGYEEKDILEVAAIIKSESNLLSADSLLSKLTSEGKRNLHKNQLTDTTIENIDDKIRVIKEKNNQLRQQTVCKICMDKDVDVVFLPCGHLVSCTECASVMSSCPYCREAVKGIVRAIMT